ncbi:MAG: hypothetical protein IJW94_04655 [Oscillospiraceae bacterium]|nr:hypothetical protein [Oscillospiraceae bacterium]
MKQYHRYQIDFESKWLNYSVIAMAVSFFATMVYYFGACNFADLGFVKIVFGAILPALLSAGFVVLLKVKKWNAPGVYGMIYAGLCICGVVCCLLTGNPVQIFLGVIFYLLGGFLVFCGMGGFLPGNLPIIVFFAVGFAVKLIFFSGKLISLGFIGSIALLAFYISACFLPLALKSGKRKPQQ